MEKRILFFDIDGTLLNGAGVVPESALQALHELKEQGHLRFVCTGRTHCMIPSSIASIDFDGYVYGGGTHVTYQDEDMVNYELPVELVEKSMEILDRYHIS